MIELNSRERVERCLRREEVDRFPIDLGGTNCTTITIKAYEELKALLNINKETRIMRFNAQLAYIDEEIRKKFKVDTYPLLLLDEGNSFPDTEITEDFWGVKRKKCGYYYDLYESPLTGNITLSDLKEYRWPEPDQLIDLDHLTRVARDKYENTDYALILCLPLGFTHQSQFLRGFEDWFIDLALNEELYSYMADRILELHMEVARRALDEVGNYISAVLYAEDLATQDSLLFSRDLYQKRIKPYHKKYFDFLKSNYDVKIIFHSCGACYPLIDDLIEIGVDALNPIQVSANGMDTKKLKEEFGSRLTFWGGGCDTQKILPFGNEKEVENEVKKRIEDLNGTGFVFSAVHNIQPQVPPQNVIKMFETALAYQNRS